MAANPFVEVVDLQRRALDRQVRRQVAVRDAAAHRVAVRGARHVAHDAPVVADRLLAHHDGDRVVERHAGEPFCGTHRRPDPLEGLPALELLVPLHREAEAGLERVVLRVDVLAPQPVALLQPERVEGAAAGRRDAVLAPGLPEVPGALPHRELSVQLPAELARVTDALRPDRADLAHVEILRRHVREGVVRDVRLGDGGEDLARTRTPQAERDASPFAQ